MKKEKCLDCTCLECANLFLARPAHSTDSAARTRHLRRFHILAQALKTSMDSS